MSRIIIARHDNGEEAVVAGWDSPMGLAFLDFTDEHGEWDMARSFGPLTGRYITCWGIGFELTAHGFSSDVAVRVRDLLEHHRGLTYPESNVVVDISGSRVAA